MKIPKKENLKLLGQEVYTDGSLVYKFYGNYYERHPENEVQALKRVKNIPRTQQFVDYNDIEKVLTTRLVKGHLLNENSGEFETGILKYTSSQLEDLFDTLIQMQNKGVVFEAHARNLFYDEKNGFTPIDYHIPVTPRVDLGAILNILTLTGVPVPIKGSEYSRPVNGKNRQNYPDIRKIVYDSLKKVDSGIANKLIEETERQEQIMKNFSTRLDYAPSFQNYLQIKEGYIQESKLKR